MILNAKQTRCLEYFEDKRVNEICYGGAAGGGKSVIGSYCLVKSALRYPRTRWLMGRARIKDLRETTLQTLLQVCAWQGVKPDAHFRINNSNAKLNPDCVEFFNGSTIILKELTRKPSDPNFDSLGSLEITGAFIDEVSQVGETAWNVVRSRIRHDVAFHGLVPKLLGTCNPSKNFTYARFYKPHRDGELPRDRAFVRALVTDNPDIDPHYIANLQGLDRVQRARLLEGNWEYEDDPSALIEYDALVDLFVNRHVAPAGERYITVDAARLGVDKSVIRVWDGMVSVAKRVIPRCRVPELAAAVRAAQLEYSVPSSRTVVDEDGVGGGVVDLLGCRGFIGSSRAVQAPGKTGNYANLRSQCYFLLADIINARGMYLPGEAAADREIIVEELEQVKQKDVDKDGRLAIIGKDAIKSVIGRSPDEADALMMRVFFLVSRKRTGARALITSGYAD
jgi:hypothetical protein